MIVVGQGALRRAGRGRDPGMPPGSWPRALGGLTADWHGFNVLHTSAARGSARWISASCLGPGGRRPGRHDAGQRRPAVAARRRRTRHLADRASTRSSSIRAITATAAPRAPMSILPGAAYTEKDGTYVNTEGRVQRGVQLAVYPTRRRARGLDHPARLQRRDAGLRAAVLDDLAGVRARLEQVNAVFARIGFLPRFGVADGTRARRRATGGRRGTVRRNASRTTTRPTRSAAPARRWRSCNRNATMDASDPAGWPPNDGLSLPPTFGHVDPAVHAGPGAVGPPADRRRLSDATPSARSWPPSRCAVGPNVVGPFGCCSRSPTR